MDEQKAPAPEQTEKPADTPAPIEPVANQANTTETPASAPPSSPAEPPQAEQPAANSTDSQPADTQQPVPPPAAVKPADGPKPPVLAIAAGLVVILALVVVAYMAYARSK